KIFFADSMAGVRNFDDRFFAAIFSFFLPDPYRDASFFFDRFDGINNQVQNGVFDLRRVRMNDEIFRRSLEFYLDAAAASGSANRLRARDRHGYRRQLS